MSNNRQTSSGGIGVAGILGVAFVILKLTGVIDWAWILVLAPFWVPLALAIAVLAICGLVLFAMRITESSEARTRRRLRESLREYRRSTR